MRKDLEKYIEERIAEFDQIPKERKTILSELAAYVNQKEQANLVFICTHNSRRSHFGQIWMQTACYWYGIDLVLTYSGGTEATAFNERAVAALIRVGFEVENKNLGDAQNPWYNIKPGEGFKDHFMFSKVYNDKRNPSENFAAVMTCSHADKNCPFVPGAERRFFVTYEDPKDFDETDQESRMYDERCAQIGREMLYVTHLINREER